MIDVATAVTVTRPAGPFPLRTGRCRDGYRPRMRWLVLLVAGVVLASASSYVADALEVPRLARALLFGGILGVASLMAARSLKSEDEQSRP